MNIITVNDSMINKKQYNGTTKKFGITYNDIDYIVKANKNDMSCITEYVASNIIKALGVPCHEAYIGIYKGEVVSIVKDFTSGTNFELHSFGDLRQSSADTDLDREYTYQDVAYIIDKHLKMNDACKEEAKHGFWQMFICDAILGNRDRHCGNWGYLKDRSNGQSILAPIFDNGGSLYPGVHKVIGQYIDAKTRKQFMYDRVFTVPASVFKVEKNGRVKKSNYFEILSDLRINKTLAEEVKQTRQNVNWFALMKTVMSIVVPLDDVILNPIYKRFYVEIVTLRYRCLILREDFDTCYKELEEMLK